MNERRFIYVLIDPITQRNGYVGMTRDPEKLRQLHPSRWAYSKSNPEKNQWIREILAKGVVPAIAVIEDTTPRRATKLRLMWINRLQRMGAVLFNKDKAQKCREASLRLWQTEEFWHKVKAGKTKKTDERWIMWRDDLQNIPAIT